MLKYFLATFVFAAIISCNNSQEQDNRLTVDSAAIKNQNAVLVKRFGDPNSPYRNEDSLINILQTELQSEWYSVSEKDLIQKRLTLALQNRPGSPANDFTFISSTGISKKLYDIKANYLLLYFYNPECGACKEMTAAIRKSSRISQAISSGQLNVLALYTDKDIALWQKYLPVMPKDWLHGRDVDEYLWNNKVYDLKAIPTVYLLDKEKRVMLKDCVDIKLIEERVPGM
jgi:hypothetical protein